MRAIVDAVSPFSAAVPNRQGPALVMSYSPSLSSNSEYSPIYVPSSLVGVRPMSRNSPVTKSPVDVEILIKRSQARILESLAAIEAATASLPNPQQIEHELHTLRESLTSLWLAYGATFNRHRRLED